MSSGKCQSSSRWRSHTPSGTAPGETRDEPSVVGVRGRWARRGTGTGPRRPGGPVHWGCSPAVLASGADPAERHLLMEAETVLSLPHRQARGPRELRPRGWRAAGAPRHGHSACGVSGSTCGPADSGGAVARRPVLLHSLPSVVERAGRAPVGSGRSLHWPLPRVVSGWVSEPPALSYALRLRLQAS